MWFTTAGLVTGGLWFWFNSPWDSALLNVLAIAICILGVAPMLRWLQRNDDSYPLAETLQLTLVPFYAIPLITEHSAVAQYPEELLERATWLVLMFQLACGFGGYLRSWNYRQPERRSWFMEEVFNEGLLRFTAHTLTLNTVWLFIATFTTLVPPHLFGTFRAIFFGIGTISLFLQARMWGSNQLTNGAKVALVANLVLQMMLTFSSLLLITGLTLFLIALLGYFSSARRVPWLVCAIALPIVAVLHSGKHQMREAHWNEYAPRLTLSSLPGYFVQWIEFGLADKEEDDRSATSQLFHRASLMQIVCYALDTVPDRTDYLGGTTYSLLPPQVIPRFLWPGKPSPNESVKILSVRLGLMTEQEAEFTSIAFGLISESYANFGTYGVIAIGIILGWLLRWVALATMGCPTLSFPGVFRILCLAWCLNAETTLVVWFSSFYQATIAVFFPLFGWRLLTGR